MTEFSTFLIKNINNRRFEGATVRCSVCAPVPAPPGGGLRAQAAQVALELLPSPSKSLCVLRALPSSSASTLDFSFALDAPERCRYCV
jgi:hypothetical protein